LGLKREGKGRREKKFSATKATKLHEKERGQEKSILSVTPAAD
jgi:hypothetical protein